MSLFEFFWNVRQQQQIGVATTNASLATAGTRAQEWALADLNNRFDRLALVTQALFELLGERAQVSEADLLAKIDQIDMRDGVRDGRAAAGGRRCPRCHRSCTGPRTTCLYCGATLDAGTPFAGL
jgi:hypothetical protein